MAKSGLKHIDVGPELSKSEWESEESHELIHGTSFPSSPVERQLFYRDDEHKWYIYNGTDWVWLGGGSGGGMEVHGNEYHDPDFEEEGVAATLVESHRTMEVHTQPQPPSVHANEAHDPDFASEAALAAHEADASAHHAKYTDAEAVAAVKAGCYVPRTYAWLIPGNVAVGTEQGITYRVKRTAIVEDVELHVKTAPTGAALIVDINEAGGSLFSTRPEIDDGGITEDGNHVFSDTSLAAGAELTMDIDQVGSNTPGADLTVLLHCKELVI